MEFSDEALVDFCWTVVQLRTNCHSFWLACLSGYETFRRDGGGGHVLGRCWTHESTTTPPRRSSTRTSSRIGGKWWRKRRKMWSGYRYGVLAFFSFLYV